jgi:hypothetical protein
MFVASIEISFKPFILPSTVTLLSSNSSRSIQILLNLFIVDEVKSRIELNYPSQDCHPNTPAPLARTSAIIPAITEPPFDEMHLASILNF